MANPANEAILQAPVFVPPAPTSITPELADPAPFPIDVLPNRIRGVVRSIEDVTQAPLALCANSVLAVLAYVAQTEADIEHPSSKQAVPLSLFLVSIAHSGERKTAVDNVATKGLRLYQSELNAAFKPASSAYEQDRKAYDGLQRSLARGSKSKTMEQIRESRASIGEEPVPPLRPEIFASEPTIEGLLKLLVEGIGSAAMFSDEGGQIVGGHALSDDNKLKTSAALSSLWNASSTTRVRAGSETQIIENKRVSAHLMVQPGVGLSLSTDKVMGDQGINSRFLTVYPESKVGTRYFKEASRGALAVLEEFASTVCTRLQQPKQLKDGCENEFDLRLITLEEAALATWAAFYDDVESKSGKFGYYEQVLAAANKAGEQALRIAAVLAVFEDPETKTLSQQQMERGVSLARFYLDETLRLSDAAKVSEKQLNAVRLLEWLQERVKPGAPFSFKWINQCGPKATRTAAKARQALGLLEEHQWILRLEDGATIDGEFAAEVYALSHLTG